MNPVGWVAGAAVLATVASVIDLHRAGASQWRCAGSWHLFVVAADVCLASVCCWAMLRAGPAIAEYVPKAASAVPGDVRSVITALGAGLGAPRLLCLLPVSGSRTAAGRLVSLRRYALENAELRARARLATYHLDVVLPAALLLDDAILGEFATLLLEECQRRGKFPPQRNVRKFVHSVMADTSPREIRVGSLVRVVLDYGGMPSAREIVRKAKGFPSGNGRADNGIESASAMPDIRE